MSPLEQGEAAVLLLKAVVRESGYPDSVPDVPEFRELFAELEQSVADLPPGVVPEIPWDYNDAPDPEPLAPGPQPPPPPQTEQYAGTGEGIELGLHYDPAERRDTHGRWTRGGVHYAAPDPDRLVLPFRRGKQYYRTPADHPFFQAHPVSSAHIVAAYDQASDAEKAQGMRWYADVHNLAAKMDHGDIEMNAGVIAALSPQSGWAVNILNADRSLDEGRALGPGEGMITEDMQAAAQRAMDGMDADEANISPKTKSFARLIRTGGDEPGDTTGQVAVDRHALTVALGERLPKKEAEKAPIGTDRFYQHVADQYRLAALEISKRGTPITPYQIQAVTWLRQQRINEAEDLTSETMSTDVASARGGRRLAKGRSTMLRHSWENWMAEAQRHKYPLVPGITAIQATEQFASDLLGIELGFRADELRDFRGRWTRDPHAPGSPWGPVRTGASARYGMVLFDDQNRVMLREPRGHFGGAAWTFSKGGPSAGETPMQTAIRETAEETGLKASGVTGYVPGAHTGTHTTTYFYTGLKSATTPHPEASDKETVSTRWVTQDEARKLIGQSESPVVRERDLKILDAAFTAHAASKAADVAVRKQSFSISVRSGQEPAHGYMVAQTGHTHTYPASVLDDPQEAARAIDEMLMSERAAFEGGDTYLGGWVHDGKLWLEPSDNIASRDEAVRTAASRNQIAIWDVGGSAEIQTGGAGGSRIIQHAQGADEDPARLLGLARGRAPGGSGGAGSPAPGGLAAQLVDFAFHYNPLERRDRRGRWTRGGDSSLAGMADELYMGPIAGDEKKLFAATEADVSEAAKILPGLLHSKNEEWNGTIELFPYEENQGILAGLDWDGTMFVADKVAQGLADVRDHPDEPVQDPGVFETLEHELIHGVTPPGTAEANMKAFQGSYAVGQIEEGFTELGSIHHAPEYLRQMGMYDRDIPEFHTQIGSNGVIEESGERYTMGEMAEDIAKPANIASGFAYGHYLYQTKDAQDWVQLVAKEEGFSDMRLTGAKGHARVVALTDEINRMGAAGKVPEMARQLAVAMTRGDPHRNDRDYMAELTETIRQSILDQWSVGQAKDAFAGAKHAATQKMHQMEATA